MEKINLEKYSADMVARLIANFPGLLSGDDVNGADLTEWLSNELHHVKETLEDDLTFRLVLNDVTATLDGEPLPDSWGNFWAWVDVCQAYEEGWEEQKAGLMPVYKRVFEHLRGDHGNG